MYIEHQWHWRIPNQWEMQQQLHQANATSHTTTFTTSSANPTSYPENKATHSCSQADKTAHSNPTPCSNFQTHPFTLPCTYL